MGLQEMQNQTAMILRYKLGVFHNTAYRCNGDKGKQMFILKLQDRNGTELRDGDIVRISDGKNFNFFSEVKYLPEYKAIAPFHTFSFHSVEKVDSLPDSAMEGNYEERYKLWYVPDPEEDGLTEDKFLKYLNSWRECEYQLNGRAYYIELADKQGLLF